MNKKYKRVGKHKSSISISLPLTNMKFFTVSLILRMFKFIGVHPKGHRNPIQLFLFLMNSFVYLSTIYLCILVFVFEKNLDLLKITDTLESLILLFHGLLTLVAAYMKHAEILDLIRDMRNFWEPDDVQDENERNANFAILKTVKIIFIYFLCFAVIPSSFFYFRPFILRKRVLAFNSYIPESIPYPILYLLETYAFVVIDFSCMAWDGFCATVIIVAYVQWRILNREIRRMLELKIESEEDKEILRKKVKRCVDHHHFLYRYSSKINDMMSNILLIFLALTVSANCIEIFKISNKPPVKEILLCVTYVGSLTNEFVIFYCIPGQLLTSEAERTDFYSYCSNWYESGIIYKKSIMRMICMMSRQKVVITAGKIVNIGMETGLQTYKVVVSYYMFLRTIQSSQ
uniref:Odorant receptor n=1 Tax=Diabrotica virgifera virgifera TaxID=50390 RepID=A0A6P7GJX8_DIAVI